jgi:hypothetical protein
MILYDDLSSNEKFHLSKIMDGLCSFISEKTYCDTNIEDIIASLIKIYQDENGYYFDKNKFIEIINEEL